MTKFEFVVGDSGDTSVGIPAQRQEIKVEISDIEHMDADDKEAFEAAMIYFFQSWLADNHGSYGMTKEEYAQEMNKNV